MILISALCLLILGLAFRKSDGVLIQCRDLAKLDTEMVGDDIGRLEAADLAQMSRTLPHLDEGTFCPVPSFGRSNAGIR